MLSGGPIVFTAAVADLLAWAHYFLGERCRCSRVGPFHFTTAAANLLAWAHYFFRTLCRYSRVGLLLSLLLLTIYSLGPIISSGSAADALG